MTSWEIVYTQQAESDLRSIYEYIAFTLFEEKIANNQVNRMMDAINGLDEMMFRFKLYEKMKETGSLTDCFTKKKRYLPVSRCSSSYPTHYTTC